MDGTQRRAGQRGLRVRRQTRDPEVGDHRPPVGRQQDVAGLDVPMDDAAHVGHAEGTSDVEPDARGLPRCQPAAASEPDGEVLPVDQGHHEVRLVPVGAGIEAGDDVRVAEDGGGERLASEPVGQIGVGRRPRDAGS